MRKLLCMLLVLAMCLSICACGKADNREEMVQDTEEMAVRPTVEVLETEPTETIPIVTEPQIVEVEITLDNWQEYFEFKEFLFFQNDDFGEFEQYAFYWCFVPKEEIGTVKDSTVALGYDYHTESHYFIVNPDANSYEWGEVTPNPYSETGSDTVHVSWLNSVRFYSNGEIDIRGAELKHMFGNSLTSGNAPYYTFDITRIEGTLTIEKNN